MTDKWTLRMGYNIHVKRNGWLIWKMHPLTNRLLFLGVNYEVKKILGTRTGDSMIKDKNGDWVHVGDMIKVKSIDGTRCDFLPVDFISDSGDILTTICGWRWFRGEDIEKVNWND